MSTVRPASRDAEQRARQRGHAGGCGGGAVVTARDRPRRAASPARRKSIRNSESPKLYSNMPGGEHRDDAGERRRRRATAHAAVGRLRTKSREQHDDEPEPERERRQPALGGNLQRHVVQVRVRAAAPPRDRGSADRPGSPCPGPTPVSGSSLMMRSPERIIASRSRFDCRLASVVALSWRSVFRRNVE